MSLDSAKEPRAAAPALPRLSLRCPHCQVSAPGETQRYCGECGSSLFKAGPTWRQRLARGVAAGAVVAAIALFPVWAPRTHLPAVPGAAPSLAGIRVGDPGTKVVSVLGHPQKVPSEIYWQGTDGKGHEVQLWEYDLGRRDLAGMAGLTITLLDGKVHQVGALSTRYQTSDGLHVGDHVEKATHLYGTGIEEDAIEGLVPTKFLKGGVVVKIISVSGAPEVLAIGIESPRNLDLGDAVRDPHGEDPHSGLGGGGGGGGGPDQPGGPSTGVDGERSDGTMPHGGEPQYY